MKNIYIISFLCLLTVPLIKAQKRAETWELDSEITGTQTYLAKNLISLVDGFSYSPEENETLNLAIDANIFFAPSDATYRTEDGVITTNPSEGGVVGSIAGQFNVSATGAATYSVPIECPKGINGMQPNLSLVYNSQSGNGIAGWGWNIGGLSQIIRTQKNDYFDKKTDGVNWTNEGPFSLDGQRLIQVSKTDDEMEYRTESETFSKIVGTGLKGDIGPDVFTVYTKDGKIMTYGGSDITDYISFKDWTRLGWQLTSIEDSNGNIIYFNYELTNVSNPDGLKYACHRLKSVTYGSNVNKGNSDFCNIEFTYYTRSDLEYRYIDGNLTFQWFKLKTIHVNSDHKIYRTYDLSYAENEIGKSVLTKIKEYGSNGEMLNPIEFTYEAINQKLASEEITLPALYDMHTSKDDFNWFSADITGDGLSDLIAVYQTKVGTANKKAIHSYKAYMDDDGKLKFKSHTLDLNGPIDLSMDDMDLKTGAIQTGNFNDKDQTVFIPYLYRGGDISTFMFYDINEKRSAFGGGLKTNTSEVPAYTFADFNNDGYTDILFIEKKEYDDSYPGSIVWGDNYNSKSEDTKIAKTELSFDLSKAPAQIIPSDYNSDGLIDYMVITSNDAKFYINKGGEFNEEQGVIECSFLERSFDESDYFKSSYSSYLRYGDFDGDGLLDFIINKKSTTNWYFFMNDGNWGFRKYELDEITAKEDNYTSENDDQDECIVYDFNNDGKDDVLITESHYHTADGLSKAHGFDNAYTAWYESTGTDVLLYKKIDTGRKYVNDSQYAVGDFNGDGRTDIISYAYDLSAYEDEDENFHFVSAANEDYGEGMITSIKNGTGKELNLSYSPLTNEDVYEIGTDDYTDVKNVYGSLYVTKKSVGFDDMTTDYSYSKAYSHIRGKGFLGFESIVKENEETGIKVTSTNKLNTDFATLVPYRTEKTWGEKTISSVTNDISITDEENKRYWAKLNLVTKTNGLTTASEKTSYAYDDYGNATSITTEYLEGDTSSGIYENQTVSYTNEGSWCDYLPKAVYTTQFNSDGSQTRTTKYTYDSHGNLTQQIQDPDDDNELRSNFTDYDSYGNPQKIEKTWGGKSRSATLTYSSDGRFVQTKTNDYTGFTTSFDYDAATGLPQSEEDHNGLTTTYKYDGFGRNTEINYPDGTYTLKSLQWNNGDGPSDAIYYTYEESSGQSPVWSWGDGMGREIRKDYYGYKKDRKIYVSTVYNKKGQKEYISDPYTGDIGQKTSYTYDDYGRLEKVVSPAGTTTYSFDHLSTTTTSPNGETIDIKNAANQLVSSTVNGKVVDFTYWPSGQVKTSTPVGGVSVETNYNLQGNRIEIIDPDGGTVTSYYNGFGELTTEEFVKTDEDGNSETITTENIYDDAGRNYSTTVNGVGTTTDYNSTTGFVTSITNDETGHQISYEYDNLGRVTSTTESINGESFPFGTTYDYYGREKTRTYPSGYFITNEYTATGQLEQVLDPSGNNIWQGIDVNEDGQFAECKKGSQSIIFGYEEERKLPQTIKSDGIIDMYYEFGEDGNLDYRKDYISGNSETFKYDAYNQLESWTINRDNLSNPVDFKITYDGFGNITSKTGIDYSMNYDNATKIHAISSISGNPDIISNDTQTITYNDFKKISSITEGDHTLDITYGVDNYRRVGVFNAGQSNELTRYYLADYEEERSDNSVRKIHYISGGNGLAAIYVDDNGTGTLYHAYTDYQGSLLALTDEDGNMASYHDSEQRFAYDPWGNRRNPDKWEDADSRTSWLTDRGYTLHEHLTNFALINMNGRVYDPQIGRFLSPDPQLQSPGNWLNYNRYTYGLNNPMLYTDPSGEFFWAALPLMVKIGVGIGAAVGGYTGYKIGEANGASGLGMAAYMLGGAAIGGFSGYLGGTIAAGGGSMANTGAIMAGSYTNSMGMAMLSGGDMAPIISFGVASFNFGTGEFGYLGKKGNSYMENLGYGLGAFANASDVYGAIMGAYGDKAGEADLVTKNDPIGHAELRTVPNEDGVSENLISVGPDWDRAVRGDSFWNAPGKNTWPTHSNDVDITVSKIRITNVRLDKIHEYVNTSLKNFRYKALSTNCVTSASNGLLKAGVLNIPFLRHPSLLQMQMLARRYAFLSPYMTEY